MRVHVDQAEAANVGSVGLDLVDVRKGNCSGMRRGRRARDGNSIEGGDGNGVEGGDGRLGWSWEIHLAVVVAVVTCIRSCSRRGDKVELECDCASTPGRCPTEIDEDSLHQLLGCVLFHSSSAAASNDNG